MKTLLIAASAMALVTPAMAQMTAAPPAAEHPPAQSSMPATPPSDAGPSTAASAPANDPKAIIASEYPTYDKDSSGGLNRTEFDTWLVALKDKSGNAMKPDDQKTWLKTAFSTADKDKDKAVSLVELTDYLTAQG